MQGLLIMFIAYAHEQCLFYENYNWIYKLCMWILFS